VNHREIEDIGELRWPDYQCLAFYPRSWKMVSNVSEPGLIARLRGNILVERGVPPFDQLQSADRDSPRMIPRACNEKAHPSSPQG
jgi:hypothetical protein